MNPIVPVIALVVGLALGWLLGLRRSESRLRSALTQAAALRATLEAEYTAAERREALLVRSDGDMRQLLGDEATEVLGRVQAQLVELERGRTASDSALREQVRAMTEDSQRLRSETSQLVTALRAPQVRGRWGEVALERIVEAAGMTEHVDFDTQVSAPGSGPPLRPDLVVRLAGGKHVVVDSKVAFAAYLEAMEARDEQTRNERLRAHAKQLRTHVEALAAKSYWERFAPTPEFVVCFVPADTFLDAALREDPTLLEDAFSRDVVLATPSTLVALLRTIAYGWRQDALAANAQQVHDLGRELYKRLGTLGGHMHKLGRNLDAAVRSYNDTVGSMERRVLGAARRMHDYGVVAPNDQIPLLEPLLDAVPRPLTAAEFADSGVLPLHGAGQRHPVRRAVPADQLPEFDGAG